MHPDMASVLASQHRHEMTAKASHHAQATVAAQGGGTTEAHHASPAGPAGRGARGTRLEAAPHHASQAGRGARGTRLEAAPHHASQAGQDGRGTRLEAAARPRGPRRGTRRPHLRGALLPRYRVTWSRTALSTAAADGAGRGRSWVIVISATRGL